MSQYAPKRTSNVRSTQCGHSRPVMRQHVHCLWCAILVQNLTKGVLRKIPGCAPPRHYSVIVLIVSGLMRSLQRVDCGHLQTTQIACTNLRTLQTEVTRPYSTARTAEANSGDVLGLRSPREA